MLVVDTNVLLRFILQDDAIQGAQVRHYLMRTEKAGKRLFVPEVVLLECVWVLASVKEIPREPLAQMLAGLFEMQVFEIEAAGRMQRALEIYSVRRIDFVDAYLTVRGQEAPHSGVLSFDKDHKKLGSLWVKP